MNDSHVLDSEATMVVLESSTTIAAVLRGDFPVRKDVELPRLKDVERAFVISTAGSGVANMWTCLSIHHWCGEGSEPLSGEESFHVFPARNITSRRARRAQCAFITSKAHAVFGGLEKVNFASN